MSLGTVLVSLAILSVVAAYIARPFRRVAINVEATIEAWVSQARAARSSASDAGFEVAATPLVKLSKPEPGDAGLPDVDEPMQFCPHCGRRVEPDHMFCPRCGKPLVKGGAA